MHTLVPRWRGLAFLLALGSDAALVSAQQSEPMPDGLRVRVHTSTPAGPRRITGSLVGTRADTLIVATAPGVETRFASGAVRRFEVTDGRPRRQFAIGGAAVGAVIGLVVGLANGDTGERQGPLEPKVTALTGPLGGLLGAGAGAVIGALVAPERWRSYPIPGVTPATPPEAR